MKKIGYTILLFSSISFSNCDTIKAIGNTILSQADAAAAIREMLTMGTNGKSVFSKDVLMSAILPNEVNNVLQKLQQLGLSKEVDKFTYTLTEATNQTAAQSVPIFIDGIKRMNIADAIGIVKNGGTAATDYLRKTVGDSVRNAVTPVMKTALDQYNITSQWNKLVAPAKLALGNRVNLNLNIDNILASVVTNALFTKIAEQEVAVRTKAEARTTPQLQRVFGTDWNNLGIK